MKHRAFALMPTQWVRDGALKLFQLPTGVAELKTLLALAIARGKFGEQQAWSTNAAAFPASLTDLSDLAHLNRTKVCSALKGLRKMGRIKEGLPASGIGGRAKTFEFADPEQPFFPFPFQYFAAEDVLGSFREASPVTLNALRMYFVLGCVRNSASGISSIGYDALDRYGVSRTTIRSAMSLLISARAINAGPSGQALQFGSKQNPPNQYFLLGIRNATPYMSNAAWRG